MPIQENDVGRHFIKGIAESLVSHLKWKTSANVYEFAECFTLIRGLFVDQRVVVTLKTTNKMWTIEKTLNLIESLRQVPALWNVSCKEYRDRNKKMDEVARLAEEFSITTDDMTKKIKSLKTQFRREHKKILDGNRSGAGTSSPCTWFGYEHLLFLIENTESRGSQSTIIRRESNGREKIDDDLESVAQVATASPRSIPPASESKMTSQDAETPSSSRLTQQRKKIKLLEDQRAEEAYQFMKNVKNQMSSKDDFSVYADYVATRLRNCNQTSRAQSIAKHQIENILFNLEMGLFDEKTASNIQKNVESFHSARSSTPASTPSIPQRSPYPFSPSPNSISSPSEAYSTQFTIHELQPPNVRKRAFLNIEKPVPSFHSSRSSTPASTVWTPQPSPNSMPSPPEIPQTYVTESTIHGSEAPSVMSELGQFLVLSGST